MEALRLIEIRGFYRQAGEPLCSGDPPTNNEDSFQTNSCVFRGWSIYR